MINKRSTTPLQTEIPFWHQIRSRLVLAFALMAVVPITVIVGIVFARELRQTETQIFDQLQSVADLKKTQIQFWLDDAEEALGFFLAGLDRESHFITLLKNNLNQQSDAVLNEEINNLLAEAVANSPEFSEIFVYDATGEIIAGSDLAQIGKIVTSQPYFQSSLSQQNLIQSPYYEVGTNRLTMLVTHAFAPEGEVLGVIVGRLNLETLGEIMLGRSGLGQSGETYLVSQENNYFLTPSAFEGYPLTRAYHSLGIDTVLQGQDGQGRYDDYRAPAVPVFGVYRWVPELQAGLLAELDAKEAMQSFNTSRLATALLTVVTLLASIGIGFWAAANISRPITDLTGVARRIAEGDLTQQARLDQRNEVGLLAEAFNSMTAQLRDFIGSLEDRVADRTERLAVLAQMNERVSAILELEGLLQEVVTEIQERFGYYHAHIYLVDEAHESLVVAEGTGPAGAEMKQNRHSISLHAPTSLVARAARTGQVVQVDNVREDEGWLPNPLLPDTYAEMAVPIMLETQVVGVLDVQQDRIAGLDDSDANILRALANQVAVAIRNANLFQEVETALAQARQAQDRYTVQAWKKVTATERATEYLYMLPSAQPLPNELLTTAEAEAFTRIAPTTLNLNAIDAAHNAAAGQILVAPIKLDNQVIGALQIHPHTGAQETSGAFSWSEEDLIFVETILNQVAQTAENLRLFEETRQQADYERLVGEVTQRIRQAPDLEHLAQTAAEAIGAVLGVSDGVVQLNIRAGQKQSEGGNGYAH